MEIYTHVCNSYTTWSAYKKRKPKLPVLKSRWWTSSGAAVFGGALPQDLTVRENNRFSVAGYLRVLHKMWTQYVTDRFAKIVLCDDGHRYMRPLQRAAPEWVQVQESSDVKARQKLFHYWTTTEVVSQNPTGNCDAITCNHFMWNRFKTVAFSAVWD